MRQAAVVEVVFEAPPAPLRSPDARPSKQGGIARPVRDHIAPDSHRPHGTYVKYVVERCTCEPCRAANREYERRRQHAINRPDEVWMPYVPAGPARRHIQELRAAGVGLKTVARVSGLSHGSLSKLMYGDPRRRMKPSRRIRPETARRILAVTIAQASGGQKIPARATWVLLDDLLRRGFTKTWIATQLGHGAPRPSLQIRRDIVRASTARAVEQLHARLDGVDAPPRKSRWST